MAVSDPNRPTVSSSFLYLPLVSPLMFRSCCIRDRDLKAGRDIITPASLLFPSFCLDSHFLLCFLSQKCYFMVHRHCTNSKQLGTGWMKGSAFIPMPQLVRHIICPPIASVSCDTHMLKGRGGLESGRVREPAKTCKHAESGSQQLRSLSGRRSV